MSEEPPKEIKNTRKGGPEDTEDPGLEKRLKEMSENDIRIELIKEDIKRLLKNKYNPSIEKNIKKQNSIYSEIVVFVDELKKLIGSAEADLFLNNEKEAAQRSVVSQRPVRQRVAPVTSAAFASAASAAAAGSDEEGEGKESKIKKSKVAAAAAFASEVTSPPQKRLTKAAAQVRISEILQEIKERAQSFYPDKPTPQTQNLFDAEVTRLRYDLKKYIDSDTEVDKLVRQALAEAESAAAGPGRAITPGRKRMTAAAAAPLTAAAAEAAAQVRSTTPGRKGITAAPVTATAGPGKSASKKVTAGLVAAAAPMTRAERLAAEEAQRQRAEAAQETKLYKSNVREAKHPVAAGAEVRNTTLLIKQTLDQDRAAAAAAGAQEAPREAAAAAKLEAEVLIVNEAHKQNWLCMKSTSLSDVDDGTVRVDGLYEIITEVNGSYSLSETNLLKSDTRPMKDDIAFQAEDTNPNGVLATSLSNALEYLFEKMGRVFILNVRSRDNETTTYSYTDCLDTITEIRSAARSATGGSERDRGKFKAFSTALLNKYMEEIGKPGSNSPQENLEKMISILKVYGALLNKGLSDTAQGGEAIKVWLLKIIDLKMRMEREMEREREIKRALAQEEEEEELPSEESGAAAAAAPPSESSAHSAEYARLQSEFWQIVHGIPFLKLISSDKIASALYLKLTKYFEGGVSSIQPVKVHGGDSSIFYLQKKFVGLIMKMQGNTQGAEPGSIIQKFYQCAVSLSRDARIGGDPAKEIFPKIDEIVKCLYQLTPNSEFQGIDYCLNYLINIPEIRTYVDALHSNAGKEEKDKVNIQLSENLRPNQYCIDLLFSSDKGFYGPQQKTFSQRMTDLKTLLDCFGTLITNLSAYVETNKDELEAKFDDLDPSIRVEANYVWSMLAETVGYYDSCKKLKEKSVDGLVALYLDICKEEMEAALNDVFFGHDQVHIEPGSQQNLGMKFLDILFPEGGAGARAGAGDRGGYASFIRDLQTQGQGQGQSKRPVGEDQYAKAQMDALDYVALIEKGQDLIGFEKAPNFREDIINKHDQARAFRSRQYSGPVCGAIYSSIDFYVGKVNEIASKIDINNGFGSFAELMFFLQNHPFKEIRTVSTAADLAAPPGCLYVEAGNMAVSYRIFIKDRKMYIYIISTFNLNPEGQNSIDFTAGQCLKQATPQSFQTFFSPDELEKYQSRDRSFKNLLNLLQSTSFKLTRYSKGQRETFIREIEEILKKIPGLKDNKTYFYTTLKGFLDTINMLNVELESLDQQLSSGARVATKISKSQSELRQLRDQLYNDFIKLTRDNYIRLFDDYQDPMKRPVIEEEISDMMILFKIINGVQPESSSGSSSSSGFPGSSGSNRAAGFSIFSMGERAAGPEDFSSRRGPPTPLRDPEYFGWQIFMSDPEIKAIIDAELDRSYLDKNEANIIRHIVSICCAGSSNIQYCFENLPAELRGKMTYNAFFANDRMKKYYYVLRSNYHLTGVGIAIRFGGSKQTRKQKRIKKNKRTKRTNKYNGTSKTMRKTKRLSRRKRRNRLTKRN
jgi:hypothetical protein